MGDLLSNIPMKSSKRGSSDKKAPLRPAEGFTLIELMVTVAMAAIVVALAAPALSDLIARNRMTTAVNTFITNLQLARSEAVKRGSSVSLCPDNPATVAFDCTGQTNWHVGYIVFSDPDGDGVLTNQADVLRHVQGSASEPITIVTTDAGTTLIYERDGTSPDDVMYTFCDTGDHAPPRAVTISNIGRPHASDKAADGSDLVCP